MNYVIYKLESSFIFMAVVPLKNSISQPPRVSVHTVCVFYYTQVYFGKVTELKSERAFSQNIWPHLSSSRRWHSAASSQGYRFLPRTCSERPELTNLVNHVVM